MRLLKVIALSSVLPLVTFVVIGGKAVTAQNTSSGIGERPTLEQHVSESDIENRAIKFKNLLDIGEVIFAARWTKLDGQGRSAEFSNERNTLGMNGSGAIEMLAREMTADLLAVRDAAAAVAKSSGTAVTRSLETKGVNFGMITANPNGSFDTSKVQGVDT